jgi:hypothetical protein
MNYVIRESTDAFKHGFESPEFRASSSNLLQERRFGLYVSERGGARNVSG